ncbi:D-alanine--poly(phosphoribitol) ligase subunit DltA [Lactococcus petauri]|uniref:D-alanine--poly(phosphoribitol) ligase subunit DltA n=1 Tax=Lactococcus petauri TaxID=1940789 RepID=UPI0022E834FE|nr:D-alanine--poly(phosphoribitol) ligase subunit DltA [Lactococcus petauri]
MNIFHEILSGATKYPERLAIVEHDQDYTYRQLLDAASQVAQKISAMPISQRPIIVFGKNGFLSLATLLGVSLTGRAYIPVDAHTPFERTQLIKQAANPSLVIHTVELEEKFSQLFTSRISYTEYQENIDFDFSQIDSRQAVSGEDINYIIYTSGTTGLPKGVAVTHNNLLSFTKWMNKDFSIIENNHFLSQALYSFDLSIFSLYPSLTTGGTLISLSQEETTNFKKLFERLNSSTINTWVSTPSFIEICLLDPSFVEENHPDLQQFIFCGEELTHKIASKLLDKFPHAKVWNTYGPTEATGAITSIQVDKTILQDYKRLPIGTAKPGVEIQIIDDEIIIIGDSVAQGYFENSEKTAEVFFDYEGKKAYHTGDSGYFDENSVLNYNGRIDFQIKFNGFRIELQDIEAHLYEIAEIEKALVVPQENAAHKVTGLIAVIHSSLSFETKAEERAFNKKIKAQLSNTIMDYMMPTKFIYLDDFPLTPNGKIDRKALTKQVLGGKN